MDLLEKEVLKYEKRGFKVVQRRTLKYGYRIFLKKEHGFLGGFEGVYIYYVDGDCSVDALRECFKDYVKFYEDQEFGRGDKGFFICSGTVDEKLFKDLRKAMIEDEDIRKSIKIMILGGKSERVGREKEASKLAESVSKERLVKAEDIIKQIKKFSPPRAPKSEKDLQNMLISYLQAYYPSIQTRMAYERAEIDATVGDVGIEIKYQPSASEFDRLYGQVDKYCRYLSKVIIVIGYQRSQEYTESFERRLKERGWLNNKVFVVTIR